MKLDVIINSVIKRIDDFTKTKFWILKSSIILALISLILSSPSPFELCLYLTPKKIVKWKSQNIDAMISTTRIVNYQAKQFERPLGKEAIEYLNHLPNDVYAGISSHLSKRWCRITVPIIAYLFHFDMVGMYFLQYVLSILFLTVYIKFFISKANHSIALISAIGISFTYIFKIFFSIYHFDYDCYALLFIMLGINYFKSYVSILFFLLASFTDERSILCLPMIVLLWKLIEYGADISWKDLLFERFPIIIGFGLVVSYFFLRKMLQDHLHVPNDKSGIGKELFLLNMRSIPLSLFATLEGYLFLLLTPVFISFFNKKYQLFGIIYFLVLSLSLFVVFMVGDLSRSITYLFPAILTAIVFIYKTENVKQSQYIIFAVSMVCVLFPSHDFAWAGNGNSWILPVFWQLWCRYHGIDSAL